MLLESGQTAVIGGLSTDTNVETHSQIPLLGDIPWLGELFQHDSNSYERRNLVVFITPTLLKSSEDTAMLLQAELDNRRRAMEDGLMSLLEDDLGLTSIMKKDD